MQKLILKLNKYAKFILKLNKYAKFILKLNKYAKFISKCFQVKIKVNTFYIWFINCDELSKPTEQFKLF
jgi:hypothetical protein